MTRLPPALGHRVTMLVLEGPPDVAMVLNAIADAPPAGVHVDEQRLCEARALYPDLQVLKSRDGHAVQ